MSRTGSRPDGGPDAHPAWLDPADLSVLADHIGHVVYVSDPADDSLLYVNAAYREVFGTEPPDDLDGWEGRILPDDRPAFQGARARTREGEASEAEYRVIHPDGSERWIFHTALPAGKGDTARVVGLAEDVTEWKRVQRARALLADTARFLSTSLDPGQILDGLGRLVVPELADWCRIHLLDPAGHLRAVSPVHLDPELVERVEELDRVYPPAPGAAGGILDVARTGRSTLLADIGAEGLAGPSAEPGEVALLEELGVCSAVIVPLQSRDRILGVMTLVSGPSCRSYGDDELELAGELAARAAVALDHAHLLDAERMARLDAERREAVNRLLVRVSSLLASPRDYRAGLRRFSDVLVPELADACVVLILEEGGGLEWVAVRHADETGQALLEKVRSAYDPTGNPRSLVLEALAGDRALLVERVSPDSLDHRLGGQEGADVVRRLGLRSLALVPLVARGRRIGVVVLAHTETSGRRFDESDRLFLEEMALRAAVAVDNAHLLREAEEARRGAEEASRAKSDFLAVMSHELRTPLNAIVGYGDLLESGIAGPVTPDQRRHLSRMRASAWHLLELIEEILSLSKIEAGRVEIEWEEVDVDELTHEAVDLIRPEARLKDLPVRVEGPDESVRLVTDRSRLRQVLMNLLANAVKFTDAGVVVLSFESGNGEVRFHVRDTGPGIPSEEQEAIFEAFSSAGIEGVEGNSTGLGLAVCRRFARLLGGDVTVESSPGEGSVFTVRLPVGPEAEQRDGSTADG